MLNVIPLKLAQLLGDNENLESSWVIQSIVTLSRNFNFFLTT